MLTPPRIRELISNCLAKDRKNRLHDIGDARLEIDRVQKAEGGEPQPGVSRRQEPGGRQPVVSSQLSTLNSQQVSWRPRVRCDRVVVVENVERAWEIGRPC